MKTFSQGWPFEGTSSGNTANSSAGLALQVVFPASTANKRNYLAYLAWSVGVPGTSQRVKVYDGTSSGPAIFNLSVVSSGTVGLPIGSLRGTPGRAMTIDLSTGGTGWQDLNAYGFVGD